MVIGQLPVLEASSNAAADSNAFAMVVHIHAGLKECACVTARNQREGDKQSIKRAQNASRNTKGYREM